MSMSSSFVVLCLGVGIILVCTLCPNGRATECEEWAVNTKIVNIEDNFGSPRNLTEWAAAEQNIYNYLRMGFIFKERRDYHGPLIAKSVLQRYFKDFEESNGLFSLPETVSQNPIKVYRMLHRIKKYKVAIEALGNKITDNNNIWDKVPALPVNKKSVPTENDVEKAMGSILRLHNIHEFNLTEFTSGVIAGIQTNTRLDAIHCYEIGVHAAKTGYHDLSIEWLEEAYSKVQFQSDLSVERHDVEDAILDSIIQHNTALENYIPSQKITGYIKSVWDDYEIPGRYGPSSQRLKRKAVQFERSKDIRHDKNYVVNYWKLCSGHTFQTEKEKAELYCWRDSGKNGVNVLSPSKLELLSKRPYILQVYDAIGPKASKRIVQKAESTLQRSKIIVNGEEPMEKHSDERTSANSWLLINSSDPDPDLVKIEQRIESITGLKTNGTATEALQVACYVPGRHYTFHVDTLKDPGWVSELGDRVATYMIYLEAPVAGGETAFAQAGIAVKPVKGAAVFWFNLYRNGSSQRTITAHGGCPVLLGHKYVGNKWIRYADQFLAAPCSLHQNDTHIQIFH